MSMVEPTTKDGTPLPQSPVWGSSTLLSKERLPCGCGDPEEFPQPPCYQPARTTLWASLLSSLKTNKPRTPQDKMAPGLKER